MPRERLPLSLGSCNGEAYTNRKLGLGESHNWEVFITHLARYARKYERSAVVLFINASQEQKVVLHLFQYSSRTIDMPSLLLKVPENNNNIVRLQMYPMVR